MTAKKALRGKPYAGNPHVRFDEGEVAPVATPSCGSLLYRKRAWRTVVSAMAIAASAMAASAATMQYTDENNITWNFTIKNSTSHTIAFGDGTNEETANGTSGSKMVPAETIPWKFTKDGVEWTVVGIQKNGFKHDCLSGALTFPDWGISIGDYAFLDCSNLTSVAFNSHITSIGQCAFGGYGDNDSRGCVNARVLDFDLSGCTSIGSRAFVPLGRAVDVSEQPTVTLKLYPSMTSIGARTFEASKFPMKVVVPRSVTSIGSKAFNNSRLNGILIPGPQVVSSGTQTYTTLYTDQTFCWSATVLAFFGPTVKSSGSNATMFNSVTAEGRNVKIYAPYQYWNSITWQAESGSNPGTLSATLYGPGQAIDFAMDNGLTTLTATPTTEAALADIITYAPLIKEKFDMDTKICVTNALTSTGLVTKQMLQTASVTFDSLTFAARTQTELDNVLDITPVDVPLVIDPAGATEELRLTTQVGRKIHVLLPEGGSYRIAHNGLMIIVK